MVAPSTCTFNSAVGTGDNVSAGGTATFRVKATTSSGSANVTGLSWMVNVDQDDTYNGSSNSATATGALSATIYSWQVLSAVVSAAPAAIGAACPVENKAAPAGSTQTIVVCGENRANTALTPISTRSSLSGTFIANAGAFSSGSLPAQSASSAVVANYAGTTVTSSTGSGFTVVAKIGSSSSQTSPKRKLTGYATTSAASWPKFHYDANNSGYNPNETAIGTSNVSTLVEKWTAMTGNYVESSPAVANGVIYVGSGDDKLYAFDAAGVTGCSGTPATCTPLWTATTSGVIITSSPTVANGVVYVGSNDGKLYAFDAAGVTGCSGSPKTCIPLWTATTGGGINSSPGVVNGVVYVGSNDGKLYAFDAAGVTGCSGTPKTCTPLWTTAPNGSIYSAPAVVNGVAYVGSNAANGLTAFDAAGVTGCSGTPKTCSPLWTGTTGGIETAPAVANGVVYVTSVDHKLYAFDAAGVTGCSGTPTTCAPLWTLATFTLISSSPAVANGVVYFGSTGDDKLYAVDAAGITGCSGTPKTCSALWTGTTGGAIDTSPAVANGVVYLGSNDHKVYAFDAAGVLNCMGTPTACTALWTATTSNLMFSSPAVAGGVVYVGSDDHKLYAFGLP
jgi:outer membrane protein assembly factor BamB